MQGYVAMESDFWDASQSDESRSGIAISRGTHHTIRRSGGKGSSQFSSDDVTNAVFRS